jgi:glycosyltransferase involved in cell wall biosynthesis
VSERIRLAFLLPHLRPGGAERVVVNYLRALNRERFEPFLFLARSEGVFLELVPQDVTRVDLGGARARRLPGRIARALAAHRIDIAYSATDAVNLALLASRWWGARRVRRIVSVHTTPCEWLAEAKNPRFRLALMRLLYPSAEMVAVPTEGIAQELERLVAAGATVLPNPVVDQVARPPCPATNPRIVAAGRLVEAKGFDLLIEAAAALASRGVAFELIVHGEGPLRAALERQAAVPGLAGRVSFPGHAGDARVMFAGTQLCVVPSRREGFGNVVVEAMAAGVPVLAAACPGPAGLIADGRNGFLVEPGNGPVLAEAIEALLGDADRRRSVIEDGLRTAASFETGAATRRLEAEILRLIGNKRPPNHPDPGQPFR